MAAARTARIRIRGDSKVSRHHGRFFFEEGWWCLRDLNSSNGIWELGPGGHVTGSQILDKRGFMPGQGALFGGHEIWMERIPTLQDVRQGFHGIVGRSPSVRGFIKQLELVGRRSGSVLLTGESGTGKTQAARVLHELSGREGKFFSVNCANLPNREMSLSELFGHVKGAFTGAHQDRKGAFRTAKGGTLFLDEFGDLSLEVQAQLLTAIEDRLMIPFGGDEPVEVDVRVIAATSKNLTKMMTEEKLREDLFYRVNVFPVRVPSLSERYGNLPDLVASLAASIEKREMAWEPGGALGAGAAGAARQHP